MKYDPDAVATAPGASEWISRCGPLPKANASSLQDQPQARAPARDRRLAIIAAPTSRPGIFAARLEGADRDLVASTRQPLLDGARRLLELGYDPSLALVMRHEGRTIEALRST